MIASGYEGYVAKDEASPYRGGADAAVADADCSENLAKGSLNRVCECIIIMNLGAEIGEDT